VDIEQDINEPVTPKKNHLHALMPTSINVKLVFPDRTICANMPRHIKEEQPMSNILLHLYGKILRGNANATNQQQPL
jgi:hypothetical protein